VLFLFSLILLQYLKIIQNPSYVELQKAANQGRRGTWEKLSAIKANCGIELALDESVAILNHMRRLKRSAERAAAAAAASSHGLPTIVKFSGSRRIPSWNVIARENSTGSLEDLHADAASSLHQGVNSPSGTTTGKNWKSHRNMHEASDSESESADLNSWTRSGGPLMRTTSADTFIDFVQNLEVHTELNRSKVTQTSPRDFQHHTTPDMNGSNIMVTEGDLLQPGRIHNGIVFNVVKKEDLAPSSSNHDYNSCNNEVVECVQIDFPGKEMDASSSASENGDEESTMIRSLTDDNSTEQSREDLSKDQSIADS